MAVTILTALLIIGSIFLLVAIVGLVLWNSMFKAIANLDIGGPDGLA